MAAPDDPEDRIRELEQPLADAARASGVQNTITVEAADAIDASGVDNKVTYRSGTPKVSNSGESNVVGQG